ncbi:MAG: dehydrogenase [Prevotella sp.]|nr:dehydrogenase [Candidatus Equicola stercoris]
MADNYLEKAREEYEIKKQKWLRKKSHLPKQYNQPKNKQ